MTDPNRGRLLPPDLDDRSWQDLVDQARALIPKYAPQWTDHNPSDLGIAIVELFAWLVEGLTYRLNRVPEKNYVAFLNLLGITREPAVAAHAFLTFTLQGQINAPVTVPSGQQVQTQGTEASPPIVFETDEARVILPINMKNALIATYDVPNFGNAVTSFNYVDAVPALLAPPAAGTSFTVHQQHFTGPQNAPVPSNYGGGAIVFGFDNPTAQVIRVDFLFAPGNGVQGFLAPVSWVYSNGATDPRTWKSLTIADGTQALANDGSVIFSVPNDWTASAPSAWANAATTGDAVTDSRYWIAARLSNESLNNDTLIGVRSLLFNSVSAHNALTIPAPETLGVGDGTPFQLFTLAQRPMFAAQTATPYAHVQVGITEANVFTLWTQVDDFPLGPGNYYRLNPVTGEVLFGSYDPQGGQGNGSAPTSSQQVVAQSYRYVADGAAGNVGAATLISLTRPLTGIDSVTNVAAGFAGTDDEPIEDTKRRAPEQLRNRFRAITAEDYEYLAKQGSENIAIVRALAPRADASGNAWTFGKIDRSSGNVTVLIVPVSTADDARPKPGDDLVLYTQAYLDQRRDLTAKLLVTGPRYVPVAVVAEATIFQAALDQNLVTTGGVQSDLAARATAFLHPVLGNTDGAGWQIGQSVSIADLYKVLELPDNIGFISKLSVQCETPDYHAPQGDLNKERPFPLGIAGPRAQLADYELACAGTVTVTTVALPE